MAIFDAEIAQVFLEEAEQLLVDAEGAFLALDAGDRSPGQIDKIFRLAHNFKGSAMTAGFEGLSHFAHKTEDVLVRIRNGTLEPNKPVCTALLKALDTLKAFVDGLKKDFTFTLDTSALEKELGSLQNGAQAPQVVSSAPAPQAQVIPAPQTQVTPAVAPTPAAEVVEDPDPKKIDAFQAMANVTSQELKQLAAVQNKPKVTPPPAAPEEFLRVSTRKLDEVLNLVGEMVVNQTVMNNHRVEGTTNCDQALQILSYMTKIVAELQNTAMSLRLMPIQPLFQRMRRSLRDVADVQGKEIELLTEGEHVELDKTILEKITDPLNHLIRNAADHGVESKERRVAAGKPARATVTLKAEQQEDHVLLTISDDGAGMNRDVLVRKAIEKGILQPGAQVTDSEAYGLIFKPGFSTKEQVTDISGRGVGMDVVHKTVEELKGKIEIKTVLGKGTSFIITLPLSLSIITGMIVSVDDRKYVVPVSQLVETIRFQNARVETSTEKGRMINLRGEVLPIYSLSQILHRGKAPNRMTARQGLVTVHNGKKVSFEIDEIIGQQQVVLKKLGPKMSGLPGVIAGAILGNGEPGLILNLHEFVEERTMSHAAA